MQQCWMGSAVKWCIMASNDALLPRGSQGNMNYWPKSKDGSLGNSDIPLVVIIGFSTKIQKNSSNCSRYFTKTPSNGSKFTVMIITLSFGEIHATVLLMIIIVSFEPLLQVFVKYMLQFDEFFCKKVYNEYQRNAPSSLHALC